MLRLFRYFPLLLLVFLGACSHITPYRDDRGRMTVFADKPLKTETGVASWYRDHRTASGEHFDSNALTAAHKTLPFNSHVRVVDLKTGRSIIVRVNDRGPYVKGRIIDLTLGGSRALGIYDRGLAKVRIEVLKEIPLMTAPNLHSTPAQIRRDKEEAAAAKRKSSTGTTSAQTKPVASSASPQKSGTTRRHAAIHRTSKTKKKPVDSTSSAQ